MSASQIFFLFFMMMFVTVVFGLDVSGASNMFQHKIYEDNQSTVTYPRSRKLMFHGICTSRDISISQSKDSTSGIPQYIVQIVNTCMSGCAPSHIHLHCGWFASARIVNPRTFKRLSYDDCMVNEGKPLKTSQIIRFTYSNSFMYPLSFKSAKFC